MILFLKPLFTNVNLLLPLVNSPSPVVLLPRPLAKFVAEASSGRGNSFTALQRYSMRIGGGWQTLYAQTQQVVSGEPFGRKLRQCWNDCLSQRAPSALGAAAAAGSAVNSWPSFPPHTLLAFTCHN